MTDSDKDKFERTVKRLLATPPQPRKDMPKKRPSPAPQKARKQAKRRASK